MRKLDPTHFPLSRAEKKRAQKREAQRKYRQGVRSRLKGTDDAVKSMQSNIDPMTMTNAEPVWRRSQTRPEQQQQQPPPPPPPQQQLQQQQQLQHSAADEHTTFYYQDPAPSFPSTQTPSFHSNEGFLEESIDQMFFCEAKQSSGDEHARGLGDQTGLDCSLRAVAKSGDGATSYQRDKSKSPWALHMTESQCIYDEKNKPRSESTIRGRRSRGFPPSQCNHASSPHATSRPQSLPDGAGNSASSPLVSGPRAETEPAPHRPRRRRRSSSSSSSSSGGGGSSSLVTRLQGCTPLFQAVLLGNLSIVAILTCKSCNVNVRNEGGQTVLHIAAREGHAEIVDLLLKRGANVNACDSLGNTPLHLAVVHGWEHAVRILVNAGANTNIANNASI